MAARLEADGVDGGVDLGHAEDLLDLVLRVALREVDGLAAEAARLRQTLGNHVADDDHRRAQQLRRVRRGESDGAGAGDVHGRAGRDARRVAPW